MFLLCYSNYSFFLTKLTGEQQDLSSKILRMFMEIPYHLRLPLKNFHHLIWTNTSNNFPYNIVIFIENIC